MSCITGDDTGLVKVFDISKASGSELKFSYGSQCRERGIAAFTWTSRDTTQALCNMCDGTVSLFDMKSQLFLSTVKIGAVAATASGLGVIRDELVVVQKDGAIVFTHWDPAKSEQRRVLVGSGPVEGVHINRRYGLIACGGKENNLCVWSADAERAEPLFCAKNVRDHVLDVPFPVYVTGTCVVSSHVFCAVTAYHEVRFYDRRVSERPVQEYPISREIERRPTAVMQWNCNKFLIGEASGDIHLYDTRRGFASRAKLRGGTGSVRCMVKHPAGYQLLAAVGLDRKARIYHVPTGKLLSTLYLKQKGTAVLLDNQQPFADASGSYCEKDNEKQAKRGLDKGCVGRHGSDLR